MKTFALLAPLLLAVCSCSTPPKPPNVDESNKRPANTAQAVDLQTCKGELHNSQLLATEKSRYAESTRAAFMKLAAARQSDASRATTTEDTRSVVYTVLFPFGGTRVELPTETSAGLLRDARNAPLILLSGRTDGDAERPAESRIARERSEAVRSWLIAAGIPPARIRTTWQPVGDHAAENTSSGGRTLNRRVEIEVYRLAPRMATLRPNEDD